jgi:Fic family protein
MEAADFTPEAPGRLVRVEGSVAFVPRDLPPPLAWETPTVGLLSAAERALGQLAAMGRTLPNPHLLIRPFMRREAVLSSRIEGTQASVSDLVLFEVYPAQERQTPDVRDVHNYVRALEYGLERVRQLPLWLRLICELHRLLMEGVRGGDRRPGEFRHEQVWIGPPGCSLAEATHVPPPPNDDMRQALYALERFLHEPSDLPPVARLALVHYQFEAIHPFTDGNGRIGRLLITLMLCLDGVLPQPLLYLSAYFDRHRQAYYDSLRDVSRRGDWTGWIRFFAQGVAEEAMDAVDRAKRLTDLRADYIARVRTPRTSALVTQLIEELFARPAISIDMVAKLLDLTPASAQKHVDRLNQAGILEEVTGRRRNRIFLAKEIVQAVQEPSVGHRSSRG